MEKKVDVGEKKFTELLLSLPHKPNKNLIKRLDSKMFSLDMNPVFNYKPEVLAFNEYSRCLSLFEKRNPGISPAEGVNRIPGIQLLIIKAEEPYKQQLQELAIKIIKDIYCVPDYVDMKAFIQPRLSLDTNQDHSPEPFLDLTLEQKNKMLTEIKKRQVLNAMCHGQALYIWGGIYHLVSEELEKINPSLKELYNYYTSTIGIGIWMINPDSFQSYIEDGNQTTLGFNKLRFDKKKGFGGQIEAKGINFPVLLHEISKGVIDWIISAGIPQDYTEEELKYYYSKSDNYQHEVYHYLLSPSLWAGLLDAARVENKDIPKLISYITKLKFEKIVEVFCLIQDDIEMASKKIKSWNL